MKTARAAFALSTLALCLASPLAVAGGSKGDAAPARSSQPVPAATATRGALTAEERVEQARNAPSPTGERVVTLPTEQVGGMDPGPQTPAAARQEAQAALAEARKTCRREGDAAARRDCLADAREDHDRLMEQARDGAQASASTGSSLR